MNEQLTELFKRYFEGTATETERQELMELVMESDDVLLESVMRQRWEALQGTTVQTPSGAHVLAAILDKPVRMRPVRQRWYWAAAAVLLLVSIGGYFQLKNHTEIRGVAKIGKVTPGYERATLTLDDGSMVQLDSTGNRTLQQGGSLIRQQGGQLVYTASAAKDAMTYNTLRTPRGGQFKVTLPDGTTVWLNAASSIRYPTTFPGKERRVEMSGEAYFEVAKNEGKPFKVSANGKAEVKVLGTHFNVDAYPEEGIIKTTLLEGAVSMSTPANPPVLLKPGQQATAGLADIKVVNDANIDQVMAWRYGLFNFDRSNLQSVMNELSRWYDVSVRYEGQIPSRTFRGKIKRDLSLTQVLEVLQDVNIKFRMEGKTIVVYN
ncbi:FecR family protein [Chitinophaga sp. YR573]|uniref:FecR family protein n=1 Tax=Chitinophaga sp. YR573 TaxID=1881040 RepID=UPI0008CE8565|nr:FecR family protein [Chitinophaga sp. YR573]SEW44046.1 FecR family protein [Chitinophaga sp. YR573]